MTYQRPEKLKAGDTVAVISPSWGGATRFPHIYQNGLKVLREWGLKIKEYPSTRADVEFLRANPDFRAKDVNDAFSDSEVKAIFSSIGGDDSVRILPFLNKKAILDNPKILMGYSDTTTLHVFCNQLGLVTFYGPSIMAGFSQMENLPPDFEKHVKNMLFGASKDLAYAPYDKYCDGYLDWNDVANTGKTNELKAVSGWRWLQGKTPAEGELFGGCLEVLEMMKATPFWPKPEHWEGKIFFLETSENKPPLAQVEHELRNYGAQGVFNKIRGLLFGRARDYSDDEKLALDKVIVRIVRGEFGQANLPIVSNVDFGHTDPQLVLPLGTVMRIDPTNRSLILLENPVL